MNNLSFEAKLTSHLTISYSAATAAGGATGPTAGSSSTPAGSSGANTANFLAALIEELLNGANVSTTSQASGTGNGGTPMQTAGSTAPAPTTLVPFGNAIDPTPPAAGTTDVTTTQPQVKALLARLADELKALQDQLKSGGAPNPDLLQRLDQTADAIAALMAQPAQPQATTTPTYASGTDASAVINAVSQTAPAENAPRTAAATPQAATLTAPPDQAAQFLTSLGLPLEQQQALPAPAASSNGAAENPVTPPTIAEPPPLPGIADLAGQLASASAAVASASPTIAQKLQDLTQKFSAAESSPQSLGALTTADDSTGKSIDAVVQSLLVAKPAIPAKPAAAPTQLSANITLTVPATLTKAASPTQIDATPATQPTPSPDLAETPQPSPAKGNADPQSGVGEIMSTVGKSAAKLVADAVSKTDPTSASDATPGSRATDSLNTAAPVVPPISRMIAAAYQTASPATVNLGHVAFEMARQVQDGQSRFSIRLDPPELGRVDVKMHVDASGNVNARLTVERSETLDMFQRDKGSLERALSQAGLDMGKTNLEFSLKQNPFAGMMGGDQRPASNGSGQRFSITSDGESDDTASTVPQVTLYRGTASTGGVNLFV